MRIRALLCVLLPYYHPLLHCVLFSLPLSPTLQQTSWQWRCVCARVYCSLRLILILIMFHCSFFCHFVCPSVEEHLWPLRALAHLHTPFFLFSSCLLFSLFYSLSLVSSLLLNFVPSQLIALFSFSPLVFFCSVFFLTFSLPRFS